MKEPQKTAEAADGTAKELWSKVVNYLAKDSEALSTGNGVTAGVDRNAIAHTFTSANWQYNSPAPMAEVLGELKEIPSYFKSAEGIAEDTFKDKYNNEVGRRIADYASENKLGEAALDDLVIDAFNNGQVVSSLKDPRIAAEATPDWTAPGENWQGSSKGRTYSDPADQAAWELGDKPIGKDRKIGRAAEAGGLDPDSVAGKAAAALGAGMGAMQDASIQLGSMMGGVFEAMGLVGGLPASTHFDITLGIDVHPFPPFAGIPFPAPYVGIVFDPFEYLSDLGAIVSSLGGEKVGGVMQALGGTVKVNGFHKTLAGSMSMNIPHIPWVAFNQGEVFMGSSTVLAEGEPFTYAFLPTLTCWIAGIFAPFRRKPKKSFSPMLPTTIVIPIPKGRPVVVGGPPTISFMTFFMKGLFKVLGKAMKAITRGAKKFARGKCFKCVLGKAARFVANPVDAATGQSVKAEDDINISATLDLEFSRLHYGGRPSDGYLGRGWHDNWSEHIRLEESKVVLYTGLARTITFDDPGVEGVVCANIHAPQNRVRRAGDHFTVFNNNQGVTKTFARIDDERYRLIEIKDANGNRVNFQFTRPTKEQPKAFLCRVNHSDGFSLVVQTTPYGRITRIYRLAEDGRKSELVRYNYDEKAMLIRVERASGYFESYTYNDQGYMTSIDHCGEYHTEYLYDEKNRITACETNTEYNKARLEFDDEAKTTTHIDGLGRRHVFHMDGDDQPLIEQDPAGNIIRNTWGNVDELLAVEDQLGRKTSFTYDEWGEVTSITYPDETKTTFTRDEDSRLLAYEGPTGNRWSFAYDRRGNLTAETSPDGQIWRYRRRADGLAVKIIRPGDFETKIEYNDKKQVAAFVEWNGARTEFTYNHAGQIASRLDPEGGETSYVYDRSANLTSAKLADGRVLRWSYDLFGNLKSFTDGEGRTTAYEYGAYDTLDKMTDPLGKEVRFQRDAMMRLTSVINETGETYRFAYDLADNVVKETDFSGRSQHFAHDATGQLIGTKSARGQQNRLRYDIMGRITETRILAGEDGKPSDQDKITRFAYGPDGLLQQVAAASSRVSLKRDPLGRLLEEKLEVLDGEEVLREDKVAHEYDEFGLPITQDFNGSTSRYTFDPDGLMSECHLPDHAPLTFTRDRLGREVMRRTDPGFVQELAFDPLGQLVGQAAGRADADFLAMRDPDNPWSRSIWRPDGSKGLDGPTASGLTVGRAYRYDKAFNPVEIKDTRWGLSRFTYDARDQVTAANYDTPLGSGLTEERFAYDPGRNLSEVTSQAAASALSGLEGKVLSERHKAGAGGRIERRGDTTYAYDAEGRLVSKRADKKGFRPQKWAYVWDEEDQLAEVTSPDGARWAYDYDPMGRRIAKRCLAGGHADKVAAVNFLWNGNQLGGERRIYADGREVMVDYHYEDEASFVPLAQVVNGELQYIVTDHLGTPRELFNEQGELLWAERRKVWGGLESRWPAVIKADNDAAPAACILRFQGQQEDEESGLYYNRFRYYDPGTGSYLSADPIGLLGGLRSWGYVENPLWWVDPFGLSSRLGGSHGQVRGDWRGMGGEVNHVPPFAALKSSNSGIGRSTASSMMMEKPDHRELLSTGSSSESKAFRQKQSQYLKSGNWEKAIEMDLRDIKSLNGNKYNKAIKEMLEHHQAKGRLDANQVKKLSNLRVPRVSNLSPAGRLSKIKSKC